MPGSRRIKHMDSGFRQNDELISGFLEIYHTRALVCPFPGSANTNLIDPAEAIFCPARQSERSVVILHKRMITPLGSKIASALRVASENVPLSVARHLFGITKLLSSRLDWHFSDATETIRLVLAAPTMRKERDERNAHPHVTNHCAQRICPGAQELGAAPLRQPSLFSGTISSCSWRHGGWINRLSAG